MIEQGKMQIRQNSTVYDSFVTVALFQCHTECQFYLYSFINNKF